MPFAHAHMQSSATDEKRIANVISQRKGRRNELHMVQPKPHCFRRRWNRNGTGPGGQYVVHIRLKKLLVVMATTLSLVMCMLVIYMVRTSTGWEVHVGSKQSLLTVPSIPANNIQLVGSKQSLLTVPSIPADMPFPTYIKSREELQKSECVSELYNFLLSLDKSVSPHVNMVFGDSQHTNLVLNWIIAALLRLEPPLHNVMVISLERLLCDTLTAKKLPLTCIVVSVECVFVSSSQRGDWRKRMMVRQPVLRLITYWGYDVAAYDSDAVLLRNPQPLYEEWPHMSVLASAGTYPRQLARKWGFALCAGTLILRSSPSTGK